MRLRPVAAGAGLARSMSQSSPPWPAGAGADGRADAFSSSLIRMASKLQWRTPLVSRRVRGLATQVAARDRLIS